MAIEDTDILILCGGMGTRLQGLINDRPKPMAEIGGMPFLDILLSHVHRQGFNRFILCTGYMSNFIRGYYEGQGRDYEMVFSEESEPLGTAGAIKNAESLIQGRRFIVMNGDSFCDLELRRFIEFHIDRDTILSMALVPQQGHRDDCGLVRIDGDCRVIGFVEKGDGGEGDLVNAGIYVFDREVLEAIPCGRSCSLEYDLFPVMISRGIYGYVSENILLDIGTPERYLRLRHTHYSELSSE